MTRWAIGLLAVALCAVGATTALSGPGSQAAAPPAAAHLRVVLRTTSDWTEFRIRTGQIVAQHISATSGEGQWRARPFGLTMKGGNGRVTTVTDDLVLYEGGGARSFTYQILKGYDGSTRASVSNRNGTRPGPVKTYTDSRHSPADPLNGQRFTASRATVMSATPLSLPRTDTRRLVLADYYP